MYYRCIYTQKNDVQLRFPTYLSNIWVLGTLTINMECLFFGENFNKIIQRILLQVKQLNACCLNSCRSMIEWWYQENIHSVSFYSSWTLSYCNSGENVNDSIFSNSTLDSCVCCEYENVFTASVKLKKRMTQKRNKSWYWLNHIHWYHMIVAFSLRLLK